MRNWTRGRYTAMAALSGLVLLSAAAILGLSTVSEPVRVLLLALVMLGMGGLLGFTGAAVQAPRSRGPK